MLWHVEEINCEQHQSNQIYIPVTEIRVNVTNGTEVIVGSTLQCSTVVNPPATFCWYKLVNNSWQLVQNGSLLTLTTLGQYTLHCMAYNVVKNVAHNKTSVDFTVIVVNQTGSSSIPPGILTTSAINGINIHGPSVGIGVAIGIGISIVVALVVVFIYINIRHRNKDTTTKLYESPMSQSTEAGNDRLYTDLQQVGTNNNNGYERTIPAAL